MTLTRAQATQIIEREGMKHRIIAQKAGIHRVTLSRWLNGHSEMKPENLRVLSEVLARYIN
ncbi:helix-turn-helix domain-containing protein [Aneurinibacillus sp. REN35]|uniref:helix-turn-helix domain-containing protein n=1 Tax=Aneurinibacillus sp. REN35 TaxID=3237286 RepID=UPI003528C08F